jgi:catechol 2,3-dioxygenase-like lactoylglutathione lyase family enzyme
VCAASPKSPIFIEPSSPHSVLPFGGGDEGGEWRGASTEESFPRKAFFGFTENPAHQPNATCVAFWVDSREEVDRLAEVVRTSGGLAIEGPDLTPEYSEDYYAIFFEDPDGNRLEVVHRTN